MAATKSQGKAFTLFIVGITTALAGVAYLSSGSGILAAIVGAVALAASFVYFYKIKSEEGESAEKAQPAVLKLAGLAAALGGWLVVVFGLQMSSSVGGRLFTTILGLAISLAGAIGILPVAARKNAFWKA